MMYRKIVVCILSLVVFCLSGCSFKAVVMKFNTTEAFLVAEQKYTLGLGNIKKVKQALERELDYSINKDVLWEAVCCSNDEVNGIAYVQGNQVGYFIEDDDTYYFFVLDDTDGVYVYDVDNKIMYNGSDLQIESDLLCKVTTIPSLLQTFDLVKKCDCVIANEDYVYANNGVNAGVLFDAKLNRLICYNEVHDNTHFSYTFNYTDHFDWGNATFADVLTYYVGDVDTYTCIE